MTQPPPGQGQPGYRPPRTSANVRLRAALLVAGLIAVAGYLWGAQTVKIGPLDCGSAWSPDGPSTICSGKVSDRRSTAIVLLVVGVGAMIGSVVIFGDSPPDEPRA